MIISIYNTVIVDDELYVFLKEFNLLCLINMLTNDIEIIGGIPDEKLFSSCLVGGIVAYDKCLYLIPHNAKKMWKYDTRASEWTDSFEMKECNIKGEMVSGTEILQKFNQAYIYKDRIFLVGYRYPAIVSYNLMKSELKYDFDVYKKLQELDSEIEIFVRHDCYLDEHVLYAPCIASNYVLKYRMDNMESEWLKVGNEHNKYAGMTCVDGNYYLAPHFGNEYIVWDGNENFEIFELENNRNLYWGAFKSGKKVIKKGGNGTNTARIDLCNAVAYLNDTYIYYEQLEDDTTIRQKTDGRIIVEKEDGVKKVFDISSVINYIKKSEITLEDIALLNESCSKDLEFFVMMIDKI